MNDVAERPQTRWAGHLFLLLLAAGWLWSGALLFRNIVRAHDPYIYGDWLINYGGGFTRRGLGGEVLIGLHKLTGLPTDWLLFALLGAVATMLFVGVGWLLWRTVRHIDLPVLFAPAAVLLVFSSGNVGRKDILVLLLTLAGGAAALAIRRWPQRALAICGLLLAVLPLVALTHESLPFYLPPIVFPVALMLLVKRSWREALAFMVVAVVLALTPFLIIMANGAASPEEVAAMCARAVPYEPLNCGAGDDAIGWLQRDLGYSLRELVKLFDSGAYPQLFLAGFALGIAYLAVFTSQFRTASGNPTRLPAVLRTPWTHVALFAIATLPLYLALDWGRWFAMWICQSVVYLLLCERAGLVERRRGWQLGGWGLAAAATLWILNLFWSVPVCCTPSPAIAGALLH